MRIRYLPSNVGSASVAGRPLMYTTSLIINDNIAIDAGCLGIYATPVEQAKITDLIITHSHMDHIASLPMFFNNINGLTKEPVRIHCSAETLAVLKTDLFNERTWVPWEILEERAIVRVYQTQPGSILDLNGAQIRTVAMDHPVPTMGMIITDAEGSVAFSADTGPTTAFWLACREVDRLHAVFVECSFPNAMEDLAHAWGHLTPKLLDRELAKLDRDARIIAVHLKPASHDEIVEQLSELEHTVEVADVFHTYRFGG